MITLQPLDGLLSAFDLPITTTRELMAEYFQLHGEGGNQYLSRERMNPQQFVNYLEDRSDAVSRLRKQSYTRDELRTHKIPVPERFSRQRKIRKDQLEAYYYKALRDGQSAQSRRLSRSVKTNGNGRTPAQALYEINGLSHPQGTSGVNQSHVPLDDYGHLEEVPIEQVWIEYKKSGSETIRNYLIARYVDIVKYIAERMHMRLPSEVDVEDLMSAGLFGLMDAIDAFDLERGVKFETYSAQRIRGAIFDELRAMDWVPRLVRSRTAKVERARKALEMELGRPPRDEEIMAHLNVDPHEYGKIKGDSHAIGIVSLNRKWFETDSSKAVREIDVISDSRQVSPLSEPQRNDLKLLLTKGLSRAERLIVILYYYEEMTMKEIGMTLDLSGSRIGQMLSSILPRLKAGMSFNGWKEDDLI